MIIIIHINQRRNNWKQILLFPVLLVSNTSLIIYSEQERKEVQTKKLEVKERNNPFQTFFSFFKKADMETGIFFIFTALWFL